MADLSCTYLGLDLKNPLIVSSSGLTDSLEKIIRLQELGAGAVVLKSLFEEAIDYDEGRIIDMKPLSCDEANEFSKLISRGNSVRDYLKLIENVKKNVTIPVIASLNCIEAGQWFDTAKSIESAGADAIELNIFFFPDDKDFKADDYERVYFDIILKVAYTVDIPITVKMSSNFTNILYIIDQAFNRGTKGVVLLAAIFNLISIFQL